MRKILHLALLTVFVLAVTATAFACGSGTTQTTTTSPTGTTATTPTTQTSPENPYEVEITEENAFTPKVLTVPVGTKVIWFNKSSRRWWVSSQSKVPDTGQIAGGSQAGYTFKEPGVYEYYDLYTKENTGTIIVE